MDFAKIVKGTNGQQVLFYLDNSDSAKVPYSMRCIAAFDWVMYTVGIGFTSRKAAMAALKKADVETADKVLRSAQGFLGDSDGRK